MEQVLNSLNFQSEIDAFQSLNMVCSFDGDLFYTNPFRTIEYIKSTKDFLEFIASSIKSRNTGTNIALLGRVNHDFAEKVFYETGLNISSYRLLIEDETLKHIYVKHYLEEKERPIDLKALLYFGEVISNYFSINYYAKTERLEVFSEINEEVYKVIFALDNKHANVYLVTLFKANEEVEESLKSFLVQENDA